MELKDFIKTALTDITNAVSELQMELANGAIVNPSMPDPISNATVKDPSNDKVNRRICLSGRRTPRQLGYVRYMLIYPSGHTERKVSGTSGDNANG